MTTGNVPVVPLGRMIRTETSPDGPPATLVSSMSTSGLAMSPLCTSSTVLRPSTGPRSNRYGGSAVASANACAAGSSTTGVTVSWSDMSSFRARTSEWCDGGPVSGHELAHRHIVRAGRALVVGARGTLSPTALGVAGTAHLLRAAQAKEPPLARRQAGPRGRALGAPQHTRSDHEQQQTHRLHRRRGSGSACRA